MTFARECLHQLTTLTPVAGPCRHMQVTEQGHQEAVGREQLLYKGHALFHTDICGMDKSETSMRAAMHLGSAGHVWECAKKGHIKAGCQLVEAD